MRYINDGQVVNGKRLCLGCEKFHMALYPCPEYPVPVKDAITRGTFIIMKTGACLPGDILGVMDYFIEWENTGVNPNETKKLQNINPW